MSMTFVLSLTQMLVFLSLYVTFACPLPDPDVGLSILVCDVEHTSFHFGLRCGKFVLCMFGQCPYFCTSLQADGKVAFEDIPLFGIRRPSCNDYSLYIFVLVLFLEALPLSQVYVAFNIFYQHLVNVYWGAVYNHHLSL